MVKYLRIENLPNLTKHARYSESWSWEKRFKDIDVSSAAPFLNQVVPIHAFSEHLFSNFSESLPDTVITVVHHDFDRILDKDIRLLWLAQIVSIAGYRILCKWVGAEDGQDEKELFWVNFGSDEIHVVGHEAASLGTYFNFHPPEFLSDRWQKDDCMKHLTESLLRLQQTRAINVNYADEKKKVYEGCRLKVGQRLELLDNNQSARVRPARVVAISGRRVKVQVTKGDCEPPEDEDDKQFGTHADFWVDQGSFFLFHVGWACYNGYQLEAKDNYRRHAEKVAEALREGNPPLYASNDVTREQLKDYKAVDQPGEKWEKGMKFELMDPLGATVRDLYVASVLDVLKDGYLRVGMDGPDAEDECIPLHCTSPLLFPVGYAEKHGITLHGPDGTEDDFSWKEYLLQSKAAVAPDHLFKEEPTQERLDQFKPNAKLEASDMCENVLICPATVVAHKGRLIHVHFDGWEDGFDQYFDIDSTDIFPVGWCELHGYKLEAPQGELEEEPSKKKKKL